MAWKGICIGIVVIIKSLSREYFRKGFGDLYAKASRGSTKKRSGLSLSLQRWIEIFAAQA